MRGESSLTGSAAFCCRKLTMSCTSAGASGGTCAKVQQALDVAIDVLLLEAVLQLVYHLLVEVCAMEKTEDEWSSRSEKFYLEQHHLSNSEKSLCCVVQVKHHHGSKLHRVVLCMDECNLLLH